MTTMYIGDTLLKGINAIHAAGHGVELSEGVSGNSHTTTIITIGVRRPGEAGYVNRLKIKYTTSYSAQFEEFKGISEEFGDLCFYAQPSVDGFLKIISAKVLANVKHASKLSLDGNFAG